jgi:hypothetical protein
MMPFILKRGANLRGFHLSAAESDHFSCLLDALGAGVTLVVEVFAPRWGQAPDKHRRRSSSGAARGTRAPDPTG